MANQERKQSNVFCSSIQDFDTIIVILVGPEEQPFTLHQDLVCAKSKFFQAACSKRWIEGQEKLVRLPKVEGRVFQHYWKWVYSDSFPVGDDETEEKRGIRHLWIDLYLLGDSLDDIQLRNQTMEELYEGMDDETDLPDSCFIAKAWSSTPPSSLMRKLLVDHIVTYLSKDGLARNVATYPPELVQQIAVAALGLRRTEPRSFDKREGYLEPEGKTN